MRISEAKAKKLGITASVIKSLSHDVFDIPIPPSVNNLFRGKNARFKTDKYEQWISEATEMLRLQGVIGRAKIPCSVLIEIRSGHGFSDGRDLDNCCKSPIDLLVKNGILFNDSVGCVTGVCVVYFQRLGNAPARCTIRILAPDYFHAQALSQKGKVHVDLAQEANV